MSRITNIQDFTNYWRDKYPSIYKLKTDEDIINLVRDRYPDLGIPTYEEALQTHQEKPQETETKIQGCASPLRPQVRSEQNGHSPRAKG